MSGTALTLVKPIMPTLYPDWRACTSSNYRLILPFLQTWIFSIEYLCYYWWLFGDFPLNCCFETQIKPLFLRPGADPEAFINWLSLSICLLWYFVPFFLHMILSSPCLFYFLRTVNGSFIENTCEAGKTSRQIKYLFPIMTDFELLLVQCYQTGR